MSETNTIDGGRAAVATKPHALTPEQVANVQKWIAALRSGEYRQSGGFLQRGDCYCCLGVACVVGGIEFGRSDCWLPTDAIARFGLQDETGSFAKPLRVKATEEPGTYDCDDLSELNDEAEWPFPRIADFIESELSTNAHGLFIK